MDALYQLQADYLKALAHPTRLRILDLLRNEDELCVCHIIEDLDLDQSNVSQHLRVLKKSGIVLSRKEGLKVFYRPASMDVYLLMDQLAPLLSRQLERLQLALEGGQ